MRITFPNSSCILNRQYKGNYMAKRSRILFLCTAVVACLAVSDCSLDNAGPTTTYPPNKVPASVEADTQRLIADLTAQGFQVTRGYVKLQTDDDCTYSYAVMKSCYANNPAAPYILFAVQHWTGEFVDPAMKNAMGLTLNGYDTVFRFDPREAIVVLGMLPPPAAYTGLQTYVFSREGTINTGTETYTYVKEKLPAMLDTLFNTVPGNQQRVQLFASLSNANNNVVVERKSGAAFNQERFFVITPDKFMDGMVRAALGRQSVPDANIFTEQIPSTMKTGLDEHADDFAMVMRYAMPLEGEGLGSPADTWRKDLPLVILRVRDPTQTRAPQIYGPPVLEIPTALDESGFKNDLGGLVAAVANKWGQPCTLPDCSDRSSGFIAVQLPPLNFVGPICTGIMMNCLADTQDTAYHFTGNQTLDDGEVYAAIGTLAIETGNAVYVGLSVNESLMIKGLQNINSDQLRGTAQGYAGTVNNTDKFYLYYFTRYCAGLESLTAGNCFSITPDMIAPCTSQPCDYLKLVQRSYIAKGTERGPDPQKLLPPKLVKLRRM